MLVDIMVGAEFFIIEMMPCLKYINMRDHVEIMAADHHRLQNIVKRSMDVQIRCLEPFGPIIDRKSTRLNSSHVANSYAVLCSRTKNSKWLDVSEADLEHIRDRLRRQITKRKNPLLVDLSDDDESVEALRDRLTKKHVLGGHLR